MASLKKAGKRFESRFPVLYEPVEGVFTSAEAAMSIGSDNFYTSEQVARQTVAFRNQYQMAVVGTVVFPSWYYSWEARKASFSCFSTCSPRWPSYCNQVALEQLLQKTYF